MDLELEDTAFLFHLLATCFEDDAPLGGMLPECTYTLAAKLGKEIKNKKMNDNVHVLFRV